MSAEESKDLLMSSQMSIKPHNFKLEVNSKIKKGKHQRKINQKNKIIRKKIKTFHFLKFKIAP